MEHLVPHALCLSAAPLLIISLVISNLAIGLAYMGIPFMFGRLLFKNDMPAIFRTFAYWFLAFILGCGFTHFAAVYTMYFGGSAYYLEAAICSATAIISLATLGLMWTLRNAVNGGN